MADTFFTRIGLLDAMGYGNLGDAAVQDSIMTNIRKRLPHARIVGFSFVPEDTTRRHGVPCHPITREYAGETAATHSLSKRRGVKLTLKQFLKKVPGLRSIAKPVADIARECLFLTRSYRRVRSLDILIMSGGGQLDELWGGPWAHPFNLFKFSALAKLARKRLYFLNVGAEPLQNRLSVFFVKSAVRLADYVSFRDVYSQTVVRSLGMTARTYVCADAVYALEPDASLNLTLDASSKPVVGINPMGFCDPRIWPRKEQRVYELYLGKLTKFSSWLLENGYRLTLFATSPGVDRLAIADLNRSVLEQSAAGRSDDRVKVTPCESVKELLGAISGCDYVVTSKYHGVIFSHLLQKPVIALGYQRKCDAAMETAGLTDYCAGIEQFELDWLIDAFCSLVRSEETIKARESGAVARHAEALRKQFDELFVPSNGIARTLALPQAER